MPMQPSHATIYPSHFDELPLVSEVVIFRKVISTGTQDAELVLIQHYIYLLHESGTIQRGAQKATAILLPVEQMGT